MERHIIPDTLPGLPSAEELEDARMAAGRASTSRLAVTCGRLPRATGQGVRLLSQVSRGAGPVQMQPLSFTSQHRYGLQAPHHGPTWEELLPALGELSIHDSQGPLPSTSPSTSSTQSTRSESRTASEVIKLQTQRLTTSHSQGSCLIGTPTLPEAPLGTGQWAEDEAEAGRKEWPRERAGAGGSTRPRKNEAPVWAPGGGHALCVDGGLRPVHSQHWHPTLWMNCCQLIASLQERELA